MSFRRTLSPDKFSRNQGRKRERVREEQREKKRRLKGVYNDKSLNIYWGYND